VIHYLDSFVDGNDLVIVLELADAGDLGKMIKHFKAQNKFMPEKTVWKYFVQVCSALQHMYQRRIMHRGEHSVHVDIRIILYFVCQFYMFNIRLRHYPTT
jgi:hypothetical protein